RRVPRHRRRATSPVPGGHPEGGRPGPGAVAGTPRGRASADRRRRRRIGRTHRESAGGGAVAAVGAPSVRAGPRSGVDRARGSRWARDLASGDAGLEGRERVGARGGRAGDRGRRRPGVEHGPDPAAGAGAGRRGTGRVAAGDRAARCGGSARGPGAVRRTGGEAAAAQRDGAGGGGGGGVAMTTRAAKTPTGDAVLSQSITREVAKRVVGQEVMVERLLVGLLTGGHVLLEGVPGLAKTLAVRTVAECLRIAFSRIQFTPDLLPADVIGTMVFDQKTQEFYPKKGPLFSNLVLADEINRAPAKVQSAL